MRCNTRAPEKEDLNANSQTNTYSRCAVPPGSHYHDFHSARTTGVDSGTASAQKTIEADAEPIQTQSDGLSSVVAAETTAQTDVDLFLDADEVEKRAAEEQSSDSAIASGPVPVSFKHVPIPLPGGIDHVVAGVATRNSGRGYQTPGRSARIDAAERSVGLG